MRGWKKGLAALLVLLILVSVAGGMLWYRRHYQMVDFRFYPRDAEILDLRGEKVSLSHYEKLQSEMPDTEILWSVPFQGNTYSQDTRELKITELTEKDVKALEGFPQLKTLDARGCTEYGLLQKVQSTYPELEVLYILTISGREYAPDAQILVVDGITAEEISLLAYLPQLSLVRLDTGRDPEQLNALVEVCSQRQIPVQITLGTRCYDTDVTSLTATGIAPEEMALIYLLPQLRQITFSEPLTDAGSLMAYAITHPEVDVRWEKTILGVLCTTEMEELDLTSGISQAGALAYAQAQKAPVQGQRDLIPYQFAVNSRYPLPDLSASTESLIEQVEEGLTYFPNIKTVFLGGCQLDNEAMAAFRETHRQDYKVVWSVQLGDKMIVRTDTPYFMPTKFHVYYFLDRDAGNLKYCEDVVAIDLGHMAVSDISWVSYMPELQYLVLAHSQVQYIEPIRSCKKLKFLELDWSPIKDYAPLVDCTALEDLNLGETFADFTPIGQMTWLKNLWMVGCSRGAVYRMSEALPNTKMVISGTGTVAGGWRNLPNYFAMRDQMGMYYMTW